MTTKEFACLVKAMRDAQKRYFTSGGDSVVLAEAKRLERAVDLVIKCGVQGDQRSLFPSDTEKGE